MALQDCLKQAVEQGLVSEAHAKATLEEFEARLAVAKKAAPDEVAADSAARLELEASLKAQSVELHRQAALRQRAVLAVNERLAGFRDHKGRVDVFKAAEGLLSHYGFRDGASVRGRAEAIIALAHGELAEMMDAFHRTLAIGQRPNKPLLMDMVRALKGEKVENKIAQEFSGSVEKVMEELRQRFNAAGGAIPKLDGWGLPQTHDWLKIRRAGREAWKEMIAPLLEADKMLNPMTGKPVGKGGLDGALNHVYDSIVSNDWAHRVPNQTAQGGKGSLANQRQDARFLTFKDADSWLRYNEAYGNGDVLQGIFNHMNAMAKDIAAMEILGPNPDAMVTYLKNVVAHEYGKRAVGKESLARKSAFVRNDRSKTNHAAAVLDGIYAHLRGREQEVAGLAKGASDVRNVMGASLLGSASVLAGSTDPFSAASSRMFAGLPFSADMGNFLRNFKSANRKEIIRSGVLWDDYLHIAKEEARMMGMLSGSDWSRNLVDISVTLSGLKPMTTARKLTEARAWQAGLADEAGKSFAEVNPKLRRTMEGFGINADDWQVMRASVDSNGFLTAGEIKRVSGRRDVAEKLSELISSWGERSVPAGTVNSRVRVTSSLPSGMFWGAMTCLALWRSDLARW